MSSRVSKTQRRYLRELVASWRNRTTSIRRPEPEPKPAPSKTVPPWLARPYEKKARRLS